MRFATQMLLVSLTLLLAAPSVKAIESPSEDVWAPIFKSNKDVRFALDARVFKEKVRQFYKSKLGLNFNEQGTVVVNNVQIKLTPVREGNLVKINLELTDNKTGKFIRSSSITLRASDMVANAKIDHPDDNIQKVDIQLVRLQ